MVVELNLLNRNFPFRKLSIFMTRLFVFRGLLRGFPVAFRLLGFFSWLASSVTAFRLPLLVFGVP